MAVTITATELAAALRVGDSTEETAEVTRLLAYATEAVTRHLGGAFAGTPDMVVNEAVVRLAAYLFDQPNAGRGASYAAAGRNSGAWAMLLPYRVHRAGSTSEAVAAAQEAVGSPGNPVTNVSVSGSTMTVTFADGTTRDETLPAGMAGVDQTARDAAEAAQDTADANAAAIAGLDAYVLPAAAAGTRGGVQAVTVDIINAGTSTGVFGWALSHVRRMVEKVVPHWARMGANGDTTLPASVLANRILETRMFGANVVDHNAMAADAVRRAAILAEAVDASKLDPAVVARLLAAVTTADNGKTLQVVNGSWAPATPAAGGGGGRWREMAQYFRSSAWTSGTAINMTLRPDGMTAFADAAAVRAAIASRAISMVVLQRSSDDERVIGPIAPNFSDQDASDDYNVDFYFQTPTGPERVEVLFGATAIQIVPRYADPGSAVRFDLGVFA